MAAELSTTVAPPADESPAPTGDAARLLLQQGTEAFAEGPHEAPPDVAVSEMDALSTETAIGDPDDEGAVAAAPGDNEPDLEAAVIAPVPDALLLCDLVVASDLLPVIL